MAPDALNMLRHAAQLEGRSVSDFMVSASLDAARDRIERDQVIKLTMEETLRFIEIMESPPPHSDSLERAREAHRRLIKRED